MQVHNGRMEVVYEVDKIVDRRIYQGTLQYRVKWKCFKADEATWEVRATRWGRACLRLDGAGHDRYTGRCPVPWGVISTDDAVLQPLENLIGSEEEIQRFEARHQASQPALSHRRLTHSTLLQGSLYVPLSVPAATVQGARLYLACPPRGSGPPLPRIGASPWLHHGRTHEAWTPT